MCASGCSYVNFRDMQDVTSLRICVSRPLVQNALLFIKFGVFRALIFAFSLFHAGMRLVRVENLMFTWEGAVFFVIVVTGFLIRST